MKTSFKLFNFLGAPVELSVWFFILFLMITPSMVLSVFISVLIHEMAHAWVAHRKGYKIDGINLNILYGTASIRNMQNINSKDSISIVFAGPLSNLILASIALLINISLNMSGLYLTNILDSFLVNLIIVNVILFIFNILPIYPLDGGRILRDFLNLRLSDKKLVTKISASVSLLFSILLLIYSFYDFSFLLILFSALFIYNSLKELDIV